MCNFQTLFLNNIANIGNFPNIYVVEMGHKIPQFTSDAIYFKYWTKYGHFLKHLQLQWQRVEKASRIYLITSPTCEKMNF